MKKIALIVAGGQGIRMGQSIPKQFIEINNQPIFIISILKFMEVFAEVKIILVVPKDYIEYSKKTLHSFHLSNLTIVCGGETRFQSVKNGIEQFDPNEEAIVWVHDAVRCLISKKIINDGYHEAIKYGNAIPAIPIKSSIRQKFSNNFKYIDRQSLFEIQTPQCFHNQQLIMSFRQQESPQFTDEATVVESFGLPIHLFPGEEQNIKITTPFDLKIAQLYLNAL